MAEKPFAVAYHSGAFLRRYITPVFNATAS